METRCPSPPERPLAVLAAEIVPAALRHERREAGELYGPLDLRLGEGAEHGDVVADGGVEQKDVLLNDGDEVVERLAFYLPQLALAEAYLAGIVGVRGHQQAQQG